MDTPFETGQAFAEVRELSEELERIPEVPQSLEILPDGTEILVIGEPHEVARFNHLQGDNTFGYRGTSGLVCCEELLRQAEHEFTEEDLVRYARAHGLCSTDAPPEMNGGTTLMEQATILGDLGLPAQPDILDSAEDLASHLEDGQGVILVVNAGELWKDPAAYGTGEANHAVLTTGVARDVETGEAAGFYINDSGSGKTAFFVPAGDLKTAWLDSGGMAVTTFGSVC